MLAYGFDKICANADVFSGSDHRPEYQGYLAHFRNKTAMTNVVNLFWDAMKRKMPPKKGKVQSAIRIYPTSDIPKKISAENHKGGPSSF